MNGRANAGKGSIAQNAGKEGRNANDQSVSTVNVGITTTSKSD